MSGRSGFRFGEFEASVTDGELRRAGFRVRLQDLPFRLLVALADRPGELVTREDLQRTLWPTETYGDFGHRLGGALNRLRDALGDSAERPRFIETVPRRGYRFCGPVERIGAARAEQAPPPIAPESRPSRRLRLSFALAVLLAAALAAWRVPASVQGEEPSGVAVLPFEDLSGRDPALSDGLTEDTITSLARDGSLSVIGRTSAMAYRATGKRVDEIARELGVSYVLEGSVRRGDGAVRVTSRLLLARTQTPVWSASYESPAGDPLALQAGFARDIADGVRTSVTAR